VFCTNLRRCVHFVFRGVLAAGLGVLLFGASDLLVPAAFAQSGMSDLEKELLLGNSEPSNQITDNPVNSEDASPEVPAVEVDKDDLDELEQAVAGPEQIPYEQILVVQKRFIQKEDRQEITPLFIGVQPANSFRRQIQWGFSWAYHLTESFGIEGVHAAFFTNYSTGLEDTIHEKTGLMSNFDNTPVVALGSTMIFTPFKSKAATRSNVYHFETYFNLGGGVALAETSKDPLGIFGLGFRAYLNRRSIMKIELRDYMEFRGTPSHRLNFSIGGGFLL